MQSCLIMLSSLWLYFIFVLLISQGVQAVVEVDAASCGVVTGAIQDALAEAIHMAGNAATCQSELRDNILNTPEWRVALNTFKAYFGKVGADPVTQDTLSPAKAMELANGLISKSSFNK